MSQETLRMSAKERQRLVIMGQVETKGLRLQEGAEAMGVSYRQAKRLWRRYRERGARGLVHGLRGRISNRRTDPAARERIVAAYRRGYGDFGPTLASEKLAERDGLTVNRETLRRWLHEERLWVSKRALRRHRKQRQRRTSFGELVQLDGSHHAWFEDRAAPCCLMVMVDDATGRTVARLGAQETTRAAFEVLRLWVERYGLPQALYTDQKSLYEALRAPTEAEKRQGSGALTDFGRACFRLGIRLIPAHSPQAKGRVERKNGVLQDRLVKELRLAGLADRDGANALLPDFLEALNERFAVAPRSPIDSHRPAPPPQVLADLLCWELERTVQNDYTVAYQGRAYQIENQPGLPRPRARVTVRRRLDDTVALLYRDQPLEFHPANHYTTRFGPAPPMGAAAHSSHPSPRSSP
jgi:transposase